MNGKNYDANAHSSLPINADDSIPSQHHSHNAFRDLRVDFKSTVNSPSLFSNNSPGSSRSPSSTHSSLAMNASLGNFDLAGLQMTNNNNNNVHNNSALNNNGYNPFPAHSHNSGPSYKYNGSLLRRELYDLYNFDHTNEARPLEEKEPVSLDSLELPEIVTQSSEAPAEDEFESLEDPEGNRFKRKPSTAALLKAAKKTRFRPCDGCRKRKTKCTIPENKRSCVECTKRDQACEYDNDKIFLFNNVNSLSGVTKLIGDSTAASRAASSSGKSQRTKPCDGCKKKRSKCIRMDDSSSCIECERKNIICTFSQSLLNIFPTTGKVNLLSNHDLAIERPVKDYSMLNEPTVMASSLSLLSSKSTTVIGECSVMEKRLLNFNEEDGNPLSSMLIQNPMLGVENSSKMIRKLNDHSYFQIVDDNEDFVNLKCLQCDEIEEIIGENSNYLIDLYFRLAHPGFPILAKEAFYERYCRNYREIHPLLLVSVYLLALNWWELDLNESLATMQFVKTETKPDVVKLENAAISLMQDNLYESPKFSAVQALILLMNYSFQSENPYLSLTWKVSSLLCTFAEEIGLNLPCERWQNIPLWERKVRKIISWSVVFHDKLYSLFEGKLSNVDLRNNWLVEELHYSDFFVDDESVWVLEQSELMAKNNMFRSMVTGEAHRELELGHIASESPELVKINGDGSDERFTSKFIFMETMKLSHNIDDILRELYSLRSLQLDSYFDICTKSEPLITHLRIWYDALPELLKMVGPVAATDTSSKGGLIPDRRSPLAPENTNALRFSLLPCGSLNLLYYTLLLLIHKRAINKYIDDAQERNLHIPRGNSSESNGNSESSQYSDFQERRAHIAELLRTVVYRFLFNLKPFNLESFWLLNTKRSLIFVGSAIALLVKTVNSDEASAAAELTKLAETDKTVSPASPASRLAKLQDEKKKLKDLYKDFHWKLSTMAPDFNHARTSVLYLDSLITLGEDSVGGDGSNFRFVI